MIAHLSGRILSKSADSVVIDVGGVGYELSIPLSTYASLPREGERADLQVHTTVRDDSIRLFGFATPEEKGLFRLFITVSGIGPRLACNILSSLSVGELVRAISMEDRRTLSAIPGIGRKATERIIIDLREKVSLLGAPARGRGPAGRASPVADEVLSAMLNLGYRASSASAALEGALERLGGEGCGFEALLKEALRRASGR